MERFETEMKRSCTDALQNVCDKVAKLELKDETRRAVAEAVASHEEKIAPVWERILKETERRLGAELAEEKARAALDKTEQNAAMQVQMAELRMNLVQDSTKQHAASLAQ